MYKLVVVKSSETSEGQELFIDEAANVADILEKVGMASGNGVPTVDGDVVDGDYVPDNGSTIILTPKKYSSGSSWWPIPGPINIPISH